MASNHKRASALFLSCCCAIVASTVASAETADLEGFKQMHAKARQLMTAHDDLKARDAYIEAIAALDALNRGKDKDVAALGADAYFELATLDERLGRHRDAESEYEKACGSAVLLAIDGAGVMLDSVRRQQVLYLQDGDYAHAGQAALRELGVYRLLQGPDAPLASVAHLKLPPTLVLARSYVALGDLDEARKTYDRAYTLAENTSTLSQAATNELYAGSVAVYAQLNLNDQIDGLKKRIDEIKKNQAKSQIAYAAVKPSPTALKESRILPSGVAPDTTAGFKEGALQRCKLIYPLSALVSKQEGTVVVHFNISSDAMLVAASIKQSSGNKDLDRGAVNGLSRCEFAPAMYHGQPVDGEFDATYVWELPK